MSHDDFTLEFRDGKRSVPPHLYEMLQSVDTYRMRYEEAVTFANNKMVRDRANEAYGKIITGHFKEYS